MQKQKQAVTPLSPTDQVESPKPKSAKLDHIEVSYGPGYVQCDGKTGTGHAPQVMAGQTIGDVLGDTGIREAVGYGNLKESNVILIANGKPVDSDYLVKEGDVLEVIKRAGEKA